MSALAVAQTVEEAPLGQAVERHLSSDEPVTQWMQDPELFESEGGDKLEVRTSPARRSNRQAHQRDPADPFRVGRCRHSAT